MTSKLLTVHDVNQKNFRNEIRLGTDVKMPKLLLLNTYFLPIPELRTWKRVFQVLVPKIKLPGGSRKAGKNAHLRERAEFSIKQIYKKTFLSKLYV